MFKSSFAIALVSLTAACSTTSQRPAETATSNVCASGVVRSDAELGRYAACARITGDLVLEGVTSLEPLAGLRQVDGALRIQSTERLYTLDGLENLENLRELSLHKNRALINAGGLNGVAQVFSVTITENPRLTKSFGLLKGLRMRPARITITENAGLDAEGVHVSADSIQVAQR